MKKLYLLAPALLLAACASQPLTQETLLYVNAETVECTGVAPMNCLQVKTPETQEWQLFYQNIEGFTFEPGFQYQLQVKKEMIENPPADASSVKYSLIKVISKLPMK
ncbi:DUF4377 domain-containing protein [Motilimonas sp. 1_MG-2023]|uniref:DUF4377 domain-containing protein n=1 Tax=Motilimonas sp. 1_MG-2023 TaxID=3062672 RepID=UPI0026E4648F|nr:DUF4377 domain-containing protein [Motilimonas sp. 1_MG-2023]MDO6524710.1 DUF4377 domain-containing protein [Motilimonas sp. 1_MG-2023]